LPLLDVLHEFYVVADANRQILYANQAFCRAAGVASTDELVGRRFGDALRCLHAAGAPGGCGSTQFCLVCGGLRSQLSALGGEAAYDECRILRTDGQAVDLRIRAAPWDAGSRRLILVSAIDTSADHRRRALERLFFHDVRNTTGGIIGFSEFLAEQEAASADPERQPLANTIARLARRLLEEIELQSSIAAAENGDLHARAQPCEPAVLLETLRELYRHHCVAHGRTIAVRAEPGLPTIEVDGVILSRVVGNFLKNALEAARPDNTITLGARQLDDTIEFHVHNPGEIPADHQLQIFQRSFSTKGPDRGLGTYGAHLLGENVLGGRVGFSSNPSDGTIFWIRLPLAPRGPGP
jgi:signal transduction histidine kinase